MISKKGTPPKSNKSKKSKGYIKQLDQRLSNNQILANRMYRLDRIKEADINRQMRDRPELSKGTNNLTKNLDIKNVFERQKKLMENKEAVSKEENIHEKYRMIHGLTSNPEINDRSK